MGSSADAAESSFFWRSYPMDKICARGKGLAFFLIPFLADDFQRSKAVFLLSESRTGAERSPLDFSGEER